MRAIVYTLLLGALAMMTIGASCEERLVQLPVVGYVEQVVPVNSSNGSFVSTDMINFANEVNKLQQENAFENIIAISIESVSFTILNNNSAAGSVIDGVAQVSATSFSSLKDLATLSGLDLDAVENVEQVPGLETDGVAEINQAINIDAGTNQIFFNINGIVTPTPPPNLDFDVKVKVSFNIVGEVKTEVPVI